MTEENKKVAIIGSGNVGSNTAFLVALLGVANVVLVDIVEGLAAGKALDIAHALAILRLDDEICGGDDYTLIEGADIVVITAGFPRTPGMSRVDLLEKNAKVIKSICREIKEKTPEAIVIVVTNPLDVMTYLAWQETGFEPEKVIGMGGLLDSGRFVHFLSEASGAQRSFVEAVVVGSHGDEMVPVTSLATVDGKDFEPLIGAPALSEAAEKARHGGAEIVKLLKTGSASYGPAAAISTMINSILHDEKEILPTCCLARGQYGQRDIYLNLPARLGAKGVEEIVELKLSDEEKAAFKDGAAVVREMLKSLPKE